MKLENVYIARWFLQMFKGIAIAKVNPRHLGNSSGKNLLTILTETESFISFESTVKCFWTLHL